MNKGVGGLTEKQGWRNKGVWGLSNRGVGEDWWGRTEEQGGVGTE